MGGRKYELVITLKSDLCAGSGYSMQASLTVTSAMTAMVSRILRQGVSKGV